MSELRERMSNAMCLRGMAARTQEAYGLMGQPPHSASPRGDRTAATEFFAVARCETVGSYADAHERHP